MSIKIHENIRNITISGRIGSGSTTLAHELSELLGWVMMDGGKLFRAFTKDHGYAADRSDEFDLEYEEKVKKILQSESNQIIQSHLAGFDAQGIDGVFKILLVCEDEEGIPYHHVSKFQKMAAINPHKITGSVMKSA